MGGTSTGANINFSNTVNGAQALVATGGSAGVVTFTGAVGGTTALTSLTASGATVTQSSTASTSTGTIHYTGAINLGNNLTTTANGTVQMNGAVSLTGPVTISTSAGGGGNITFASTLDGGQALIVNGEQQRFSLRAQSGGRLL